MALCSKLNNLGGIGALAWKAAGLPTET